MQRPNYSNQLYGKRGFQQRDRLELDGFDGSIVRRHYNVRHHANPIDPSGVTNPAPMAVYQTGRDGNFTYTIPGFTAGSSHTVRLHFAETYWSTAGSRIFNVSINGTAVLTNFDIFAAAGAKNKAIIEQFTVNANSSGQYVIKFTTVKDNSLINGIEVQ